MICCVIVLRLLAWVYERCGLASGVGGTTARKLPVSLVLLFALASVEIALAIAFLGMLRAPGHAGHMHHDAGQMHGVAPVPHGSAIFAIASTAVVGVLVFSVVRGRRKSIRGAGLLLAAGMAALSQSTAMLSSHLVVMVALESLTVVAPLFLIGIAWNRGPADDVWVIGRAALAIVAAAGVVAVILSAHADSMGHATWLGAHWWSASVALAISTLFWTSVLRFRLPRPLRFVTIGLVLEVGSLLAITMLLRAAPMGSPGPMGLSALADQRLAGLSMMLVDTTLLGAWLRASGVVLRPRLSAGLSA